MKMFVWIVTSFEGYHRWKDAPKEVEFLREWHRHIFHVRLEVPVNHDNRDVEFIMLKQSVEAWLDVNGYLRGRFEESCEQIAIRLANAFSASQVEVSEDGENGARIVIPSKVEKEQQELLSSSGY